MFIINIYEPLRAVMFIINMYEPLPTCVLTYCMEQCRSGQANRFSASQEIPRFLMEPEGSLPQSQMPATCPYPEPAPFSPHPHIPLPEDPSQYYPTIYAWVSQVIFFPLVFPPELCMHLSSPPYALHAPPISFFLILSPEEYWVKNTDH